MNISTFTKEKIQDEQQLTAGLKHIFAVSEAYPDLKANQNFLQLQTECVEIEDRLQAARRAYNASVNVLHNLEQQFPSNLVASMMTIPVYEMFSIDENESVLPKVSDTISVK